MILLRERLRQQNTERLLAIARHWGVSGAGANGRLDPEAMAARMAADTPARTAFDRLAPAEKAILRAMDSATHKGWIVTADIRRLTSIPESRVPELLCSLEAKAVAFAEERELPAENPYWGPTWAGRRLPTRATPVIALPEDLAPVFLSVIGEFAGSSWHAEVPSPLNHLEMQPLETLHAMAGHYGMAPDGAGQSPTKMAALLQRALKDHGAIWQVICALPLDLRRVLNAVEAAGGRLPMEQALQRFGPEYERIHAAVRALTERGLAFDRFVHRQRVLLAPDRVLEAIARHSIPEFPRARLQPVPDPPMEHRWRLDLHWSLLQLARLIRLEGLSRAATTRMVPKRTAARLAAQMRRPPEDRPSEEWAEQTIRYLQAVGVLAHSERIHLAQEDPPWIRQNVFTQARMLLERWGEGQVEDLRQQRVDFGLWMDHSQRAAGRGLLLDLLRRCRPGQWYSVDSLLRRAAALRPFFLRERDRLVRQQGYRGLKRMLATWFEVEARVLILHLTGLPLEAGLVALDRTLSPGARPPQGAAFRVTDWGAALLDRAPAPPEPDMQHALLVQPNFEVVVMEFAPALMDTLGQFATPVAYDHVATYRIEQRGINLAVANGWSADQMLRVLNTHARAPVPQNVAQTIRDWSGAVRRARYVRALVVEADDPAILEELAACKMLREGARGITPKGVLLVDPEVDLKRLARDLRLEGFVLESSEE